MITVDHGVAVVIVKLILLMFPYDCTMIDVDETRDARG